MLLIGAAALLLIGILVEQFVPARYCPIRGVVFNVVHLVPAGLLRAISVAAVAGAVIMLTNMIGGGLFVLPSTGWLLIPAVVIFTVAMDFSEFLFHRLQHLIPALWAMHSFHHSDEAMNVSTAYRHFWAEHAIKASTIYLLVGLLFNASPLIISIYALISFYSMFPHMNVRVGLGRWWLLLNSPQYHRIHHSSLAEHQDRNFAAIFPIFDAIVRTSYRPHPGEFPPTGLYDQDKPRSLIEAVVWPVRSGYRRLRTAPMQRSANAAASNPAPTVT
jgi:sterol desaturase/sphingolipid hydroxylase (fatty acid hydroxylase superfamily)